MVNTASTPCPQFHVIVDLAGVSMMHFGGVRVKCMNACLRVFEQHYKERLGRAVVVNAPAWWGFMYVGLFPCGQRCLFCCSLLDVFNALLQPTVNIADGSSSRHCCRRPSWTRSWSPLAPRKAAPVLNACLLQGTCQRSMGDLHRLPLGSPQWMRSSGGSLPRTRQG